MRFILHYSAILVAFDFLISCDNSINPAAPFEPRLVVFSVLSTQTDTQYVRVYTSYSPPENDPYHNADERSLANANVTITDGTATHMFRYTSTARPDTSRYSSKIGLYYAYPFRPQANKEYTLSVSSPTLGQATSKTRVPASGAVSYFDIAILHHPDADGFGKSVLPQFTLDDLAKAQLLRFYVVYTTENAGDDGREHYREVPILEKLLNKNLEIHQTIYATPQRRTAPLARRGEPFTLTIEYPFPAYQETVYQIQHFNINAHFKRAVFVLIQFDEPWYKYYASANLFQDKLAVRVDPPDYSNIQGGWGVFGSIRVDSLVIPLPDMLRGYPPRYDR